MKVMLFLGCLVDAHLSQIGIALHKLLLRAGMDVVVPDQICCGSPLIKSGLIDAAKELIVRNMRMMEAEQPDYVVTPCPECWLSMKRDWERISGLSFEFKVIHHQEFLAQQLKLEHPMKPLELRATYADPCYLAWENPGSSKLARDLLRSIPGLELMEMEQPERCCGGGGGLMLMNPELSLKLARIKLEDALRINPDILITSCPYCKLQLLESVRIAGARMKILDISELMEECIE